MGILSCGKAKNNPATVTGNWVSKSDFNGVSRSEAVAFVINDTAYIGTGYDGNNRLKDIWAYNAAGNYWYQKADFQGTARNSAVAFQAAGKGYIATGYDGVNSLKDMWQFNPIANTWVQKADFAGTARYDAVGFGILDKGYIGTGFDGNYLKDFWVYNPGSDSWAQNVGFGGAKREQAVAFVYNNKAYIATGVNNGTYENDFWSFDPAASAWTQLRSTANVSTDSYDDNYGSIDRANAVAFVIADKAYLTTGDVGSLLSSTWEYDFKTDTWVTKQAFEGAARTGAVGFSIAAGGFVTTGRSSTFTFDDLRQFFPADAYNAND